MVETLVERLKAATFDIETGEPLDGDVPVCVFVNDAREATAALTEAQATLEAAEAENARLREALGDLVSWFDGSKPDQPVWQIAAGKYGADGAINAARAALQEREK